MALGAGSGCKIELASLPFPFLALEIRITPKFVAQSFRMAHFERRCPDAYFPIQFFDCRLHSLTRTDYDFGACQAVGVFARGAP